LLGADGPAVETVRKDIRDIAPEDLEEIDSVVHLAALSNDPIGNLNERWTREINAEASVGLARMARDAGVERFVFSSSCIMYGMSEAEVVDETTPLDPQTEYARSKVEAERGIGQLASDSFSPTFLRNGTVYGLSPRMRFDTVLNDLVGAAATSGVVSVHGDGTPWRPVVHVEDVARAFAAILEAPRELVHDQAFNTGADELNRQVCDLARAAAAAVPGARVETQSSPAADRRTYRADFSKWSRTFPSFEWRWSPEAGARDLAERFGAVGLTPDAYADARFTRLRWLSHLLDAGRLDSSLRWAAAPVPT
jgi:nucleoside-diphosphate-sugar epimerase